MESWKEWLIGLYQRPHRLLPCIESSSVVHAREAERKSQLEGNVILLLIMTICTTSYIVEAGEDPHQPGR